MPTTKKEKNMENIKKAFSAPVKFNKFVKLKQTPVTAIILNQLFLIFISFSIVYYTYHMQKYYDYSTMLWLFEAENIPMVVFSFLVIFVTVEFLYLATFFLFVPMLTYPICFILAFINDIKLALREEPFIFNDILLVKESASIAKNYNIQLNSDLKMIITVFISMVVTSLFIKRIKLNWKKRLICFSAGIVCISLFSAITIFKTDSYMDNIYIRVVWDLKKEYKDNGFILAFLQSYKRTIITAPDGYTKENVEKKAELLGYDRNAAQNAFASFQSDTVTGNRELPNVIVIMSETYWDTKNFTGIRYNADPMSSVRDIIAEKGGGTVLSPTFGGGTSNAEYEFLTGKSILFYPESSIVYQQYINESQWSLAWYFKEFGYTTTAIHPYFSWYWKRRTVYPLLGFDHMYFKGELNYIDVKGNFISDRSLSKEIIDRYERLSNDGITPIFTFAVSMQNHGDYYDSIYPDRETKLTARSGDEFLDAQAEVFGEGIKYASEAFVYLTEYFEKIERPTYIVMFGDHAPTIAKNPYLYILNEEDDLTETDKENLYITPFVVWSNTDEKFSNFENMSLFMLTEELFNITRMPKPPYISMLSKIKETTRGFTDRYVLDGNGDFCYQEKNSELYKKISDLIKNLEIVQYDATIGKQYIVKEEFRKDS